ncbi:MAG: PilZ domain-containing protein [Planctomycetota bacterium]
MIGTKERRQWKRRSLDATVLYRLAGEGGAFQTGQMRDLSEGGVSFDTDEPPAEGTLVDMFFKEHANDADRRVRGRVIWRRVGPGLSAVGVSFEE